MNANIRSAYCLVILTVIADQATKLVAGRYHEQFGRALSIGLPGDIVHFFYLRNFGGILGALSNFQPLLIIITLVVLVVLLRLMSFERFAAYRSALALIIGGGTGNLLDRLHSGAVIDFIQLRFIWTPGIVLNVADLALFTGGVLIGSILVLNSLKN